jgi:hypothetical protein
MGQLIHNKSESEMHIVVVLNSESEKMHSETNIKTLLFSYLSRATSDITTIYT